MRRSGGALTISTTVCITDKPVSALDAWNIFQCCFSCSFGQVCLTEYFNYFFLVHVYSSIENVDHVTAEMYFPPDIELFHYLHLISKASFYLSLVRKGLFIGKNCLG